eukprot:gb/GECH01011230.1/.p1 GENE.gb/GECH01011230.1/~~gb/GECH01011230.1/.p1  ORF type:complete len:249 (+),score=44.32 gb/GECH01011230.1/:1-747(+)
MKLNIAYPATGSQKTIELNDEKKLRTLFDRRISQEVEGSLLGDEYQGYIFKITGGHDKDGFPMCQGILTAGRVRLLLKRGGFGFQAYRGRPGERRRKSVRGCIIGPDTAVLHLVIVKKGENELEGITDTTQPRVRGPKRASKIRRLFKLDKKDDVRKFVIRHKVEKNGKTYYKSPKIQRLVTPQRLQRKRRQRAIKQARRAKSQQALDDYQKLLRRVKQQKIQRHERAVQKRAEKRKAQLEKRRAKAN